MQYYALEVSLSSVHSEHSGFNAALRWDNLYQDKILKKETCVPKTGDVGVGICRAMD